MSDLVFDLSPTQAAFARSEAHIVQLKGPMGEGKTHGGVAGMIAHAQRLGEMGLDKMTGALVRDTHQNIKSFTAPDIDRILGPKWVSFHDDCRKMVVNTYPRIELDLFGSDNMQRFQGLAGSFIWIEEPAPVEEKANAGVPKKIFDISVARAARQQGGIPRVQLTQNPADEDHWTEELTLSPRVYARDPKTGEEIIYELFDIPYRDNRKLTNLARVANMAAFKDDPGKYARYVEGKAAPVQLGSSVTPGYNQKIHLADDELPVLQGVPGLRFWDGWHHPVCMICQYLPPGRIWIHAALITGGEGGVAELIPEQVIPLLATPKYHNKFPDWRDIGDPTMRIPDQSSKRTSAHRTVQTLLNTRFESGPARWANRKEAINKALRSMASDGSPLILISRSAYKVHRALNGGWHFKIDHSGKIIGNKPVKDQWADLGDALSYGCAKVFPVLDRAGRKATRVQAAAHKEEMDIAMSYAPSMATGK